MSLIAKIKEKLSILSYLTKQQIRSLFILGRLHRKPDFEYFYLFEQSIELFIEKKLLFIHIPKTAGIAIYNYVYNLNDTYGHFSMRNYENYVPRKQLKSLKKFTVIRNPYERILSAYCFLHEGGVKQEDEKWAEEHLQPYQNFEDFILNGLDKEAVKTFTHFIPQVHFLKNKQGKIQLDVLLKHENLKEDIKSLKLKKDLSEFKVKNKSSRKTNKDDLSDAVKEKIYSVYEEDFLKLGYSK